MDDAFAMTRGSSVAFGTSLSWVSSVLIRLRLRRLRMHTAVIVMTVIIRTMVTTAMMIVFELESADATFSEILGDTEVFASKPLERTAVVVIDADVFDELVADVLVMVVDKLESHPSSQKAQFLPSFVEER